MAEILHDIIYLNYGIYGAILYLGHTEILSINRSDDDGDDSKPCNHLPLPSKDSYVKAFGPKDPLMYGFRAILMQRVSVSRPKP